jgi:hypothetical protein
METKHNLYCSSVKKYKQKVQHAVLVLRQLVRQLSRQHLHGEETVLFEIEEAIQRPFQKNTGQ